MVRQLQDRLLLLLVLLHWYFITSRLFIPFPAIVFYKYSFRAVLIYISGMASKGNNPTRYIFIIISMCCSILTASKKEAALGFMEGTAVINLR